MSNYLYVIHCNEDIYKIGVANDVSKRLASLQTGNPFQLTVLYCYEFNKAILVESVLHKKLDSKRLAGEWFKLDSADLEEMARVCELLNGKRFEGFSVASQIEIREAEEIQELILDNANIRIGRRKRGPAPSNDFTWAFRVSIKRNSPYRDLIPFFQALQGLSSEQRMISLFEAVRGGQAAGQKSIAMRTNTRAERAIDDLLSDL